MQQPCLILKTLFCGRVYPNLRFLQAPPPRHMQTLPCCSLSLGEKGSDKDVTYSQWVNQMWVSVWVTKHRLKKLCTSLQYKEIPSDDILILSPLRRIAVSSPQGPGSPPVVGSWPGLQYHPLHIFDSILWYTKGLHFDKVHLNYCFNGSCFQYYSQEPFQTQKYGNSCLSLLLLKNLSPSLHGKWKLKVKWRL